MLGAAVKYAGKMGASILEAYPVDKKKRGKDEWFWFGAKSMYDRAGFYSKVFTIFENRPEPQSIA